MSEWLTSLTPWEAQPALQEQGVAPGRQEDEEIIAHGYHASNTQKRWQTKGILQPKGRRWENKMSGINALRAKIVARMFAGIKNSHHYTPTLS